MTTFIKNLGDKFGLFHLGFYCVFVLNGFSFLRAGLMWAKKEVSNGLNYYLGSLELLFTIISWYVFPVAVDFFLLSIFNWTKLAIGTLEKFTDCWCIFYLLSWLVLFFLLKYIMRFAFLEWVMIRIGLCSLIGFFEMWKNVFRMLDWRSYFLLRVEVQNY